MHNEKYDCLANRNFLNYEFESYGPKGSIKKVVRFSPQNADGITYFNLGFGDLNTATGEIDDLSISDNKDKDIVLSTIASIVIDFTSVFPDIMVYAKGSTSSRNRLYQMGIAANLEEITALVEVFGFKDNTWKPFEKNINYEAFIVLRKQK
ncbi:MAG: hypothetical protein V4649_03040 [Bacteroidota bacterium]